MNTSYIVRYIWRDIWHSVNRPFTLINLIAIGISTAVLVLLAGGFFAFQANAEKVMDKLGLSIEVTAREERVISDEVRQKLGKLPGMSAISWWTPIRFLFYDKGERLHEEIEGRTLDMKDPVVSSFQDFRTKEPIRFKTKQELGKDYYDELGFIAPFLVLKQLGYIPPAASAEKIETWKNLDLPTHLEIRLLKDGPSEAPSRVRLPIVGILPESEGGRYFVTKDCYKIFLHAWQDAFMPFLMDRYNRPLFPDAKQKATTTPVFFGGIPSDPDTHATVYANTRKDILPLLQEIRGMGLKADCALEDYLGDYEEQEIFFMASGGGICVVMFFFAGVILFSTFQALILRKLKEIGILKACGFSPWLIYKIFLGEAITLSGMSTLLGILLGVWGGNAISQFVQKEFLLPDTQWFILPFFVVAAILACGIFFCILVTFLPVTTAVKVDPDVVIRG